MIPYLPPLWACTLAGGLAAGAYGMHTWHTAQRVDAIEQARKDERSLQRGAGQADIRYIDRLQAQRVHAESNANKFRRALNEANSNLAACRVDADVVELLDEAGMSGPAGDPAEPRPPAAGAEASRDSSCDVEIERAADNYRNVCVPNAIQLRELQGFCRDVIRKYNCAIGRCD